MEDIINDLLNLKNSRGKKYLVEPVYEVPLETIEHQIVMKAHRVARCVKLEDKIDNARDLVVYTLIWLERVNRGDLFGKKGND